MEILPDEISDSIENDIILLDRLVIELEERSRYLYYTYDPRRPGITKYEDFHKDQHHFVYLKGAQRSGKSFAAYEDIFMMLLDEQPYKKLKNMNSLGLFVENSPPYTCWIVASTFKKVIEHYWTEINRFLPKNRVASQIYDEKNNKFHIYFDNGSKIIFKSKEERIDAFKSAAVHIVLQDEREENEERRLQLKTRIVSNYGYYYTTMDTSESDDYIEESIQSGYGILYEFCLKDNEKYLPKESIEMIEGMKDSVDKERMFYGKHADRDIEYIFTPGLWNELNYVPIIPNRFSYNTTKILVPDEEGYIRIFKQPENGVRYYAGHDPASGNGTGNANSVQIWNEYGEQCATIFNNNISYVNIHTVYLIPILRYYNNALYIPECKSDFATYIIQMVLKEYKNVYVDESVHAVDSFVTHVVWGIRTNEQNKKDMKSQVLADFTNNIFLLHDEMTKIQLEGFVADYRDRNSQKKEPKYHGTKTKDMKKYPEMKNSTDDLVMALFFVSKAMNKNNEIKSRETKVVNKKEEVKFYYNNNSYHSYYSR